jgi:hypothetical protein
MNIIYWRNDATSLKSFSVVWNAFRQIIKRVSRREQRPPRIVSRIVVRDPNTVRTVVNKRAKNDSKSVSKPKKSISRGYIDTLTATREPWHGFLFTRFSTPLKRILPVSTAVNHPHLRGIIALRATINPAEYLLRFNKHCVGRYLHYI